MANIPWSLYGDTGQSSGSFVCSLLVAFGMLPILALERCGYPGWVSSSCPGAATELDAHTS